MKSLKEIAWNVTEPEYRADSAFSYSTLSKLQRNGPESLRDNEVVESESLRFGSLVDCLITEPETLNDRFRICDFDKPSQNLCDAAKWLYEGRAEDQITIRDFSDAKLLAAAEYCGYGPNWKPETRIRDIKAKCESYYRLLTVSDGKIIMSSEDFEQAQNCVKALHNDGFTWFYFSPTSQEKLHVEHERLFQLKFKASYKGIPVRCMFDEIIVDHGNKLIYPIDLKTSSSKEYKFNSSMKEWNYYIQAELYYYILKENLAVDEYFKDFTVMNPKFIVINRYRCKPMVWIYNLEKFHLERQHKWLDEHGYKPWSELLIEAHFHVSNELFDYPMEVYKNGGKMEIDFYKDLNYKFNPKTNGK